MRLLSSSMVRAAGALFLVGGALGGCVAHVTTTSATTMRNPLASGSVEASTIIYAHPNTERTRDLPPHVLDDEATITSIDAQSVCVGLVLRSIQDGDGMRWASLDGFDTALSTVEQARFTPSSVQPAGTTLLTLPGLNPEERVIGSERVCVTTNERSGQCEEWQSRNVTETAWTPGQVTIIAGGGSVCFSHAGQIHAGTRGLTLDLTRGRNTARFEWAFAP